MVNYRDINYSLQARTPQAGALVAGVPRIIFYFTVIGVCHAWHGFAMLGRVFAMLGRDLQYRKWFSTRTNGYIFHYLKGFAMLARVMYLELNH